MWPQEIHSTAFFLKLFVYIVLFNVAILSTSVVLHEGGHFIGGTMLAGCSGEIILYDMKAFGPYTLLDCPAAFDKSFLYLTSMLLLVPYSLFFLVLKEFPERNYFIVVLGISIFTAALDLKHFTGSDIAYYLSVSAGIIVFLAGQYMLVDKIFLRFEERLEYNKPAAGRHPVQGHPGWM